MLASRSTSRSELLGKRALAGGQVTPLQQSRGGQIVTTGSNNIEIGSTGAPGDNGTLRIGTQGTQAVTYIAGIYSSKITGSQLLVTSSGQLGVGPSSQRYKTAITSMGSVTAKLDQLRPASFHLKSDPDGVVQYGLIAEEVDKVYPELVIRDASGVIQGVRYDELAPMLLNFIQQQHHEIAEIELRNRSIQAALDRLEAADLQVAKRKFRGIDATNDPLPLNDQDESENHIVQVAETGR